MFSLNDVVHSGLKLLRAQLEHHGILLGLELADGLPAVAGHPQQLEQVLLNLSIADAIVRRHEGRITCESRVGHGTVFRVTLPAAEAGR